MIRAESQSRHRSGRATYHQKQRPQYASKREHMEKQTVAVEISAEPRYGFTEQSKQQVDDKMPSTR